MITKTSFNNVNRKNEEMEEGIYAGDFLKEDEIKGGISNVKPVDDQEGKEKKN